MSTIHSNSIFIYKGSTMQKSLSVSALLLLTTIGLVSPSSATLILSNYASGVATPTTIGGYAMTDFAVTNGIGGSTTAVASPISGSLNFVDIGNNPLPLTRDLADSVSWWNNGESSDYDVFTTDVNLITILLPENTFAFSFNVGANLVSTGLNAWLTATETNGAGINNRYHFNVNKNNTPGFGIHVDNSNGSCSTLTSVTIEPDYWGVGNFSINQNSNGCEVPEPPSITLLCLGLLGVSVARWKRYA